MRDGAPCLPAESRGEFPSPHGPYLLGRCDWSPQAYFHVFLHIDWLLHMHKARDMQPLPARSQMQQSGRGVSQPDGHTCAVLTNRHRKVSEGLNGPYNNAILIVCHFLKKTEVNMQK